MNAMNEQANTATVTEWWALDGQPLYIITSEGTPVEYDNAGEIFCYEKREDACT